jgi:hypothetical protein
MDATSALMMTLGAAALLGSWILLLIETSNEDFAWGLCSLLMPPLSYLYGLFRLDVAGEPIALAGIGWGLIFLSL